MAKRKTTEKPAESDPTRIALWPLSEIKEYPNNPRTHPTEQIDKLADQLRRFGPDQAIVVDEHGEIIKGHGRKLAAAKAEMTHFPVYQRFGLSEAEKKAIRIADNQIALLSGWDNDALRLEISDLRLQDFDLKILGFDDKGLSVFLQPQDAPKNPDFVVPPPKKPMIRAGEIWELGQHRIICGDSTDPKTWASLMAGDRAAMVFTDPPYGVSYEAQSGEFDVIEGDHKRRDDLYKMLVGAFKCLGKIAEDAAAFYIWHASSTRNDFAQAMTAAGLIEKQYLIWAKPGLVLGRADYQWSHEPCFYASKDGRPTKFYGDRAESTVWRIAAVTTDHVSTVIGSGVIILGGDGKTLFVQPKAPKSKKAREIRVTAEAPTIVLADSTGTGTVWEIGRDSNYVHPTQKPVALAVKAIENSSKSGEIVVDAFSGSGTTLMGCEMTGRRARVAELDPKYVQAAIERWQDFTGQAAMLAGSGQTFAEVAKQRSRGKKQ